MKNVKFPGYCFYMNTNILGDFQICIIVPLIITKLTERSTLVNFSFAHLVQFKKLMTGFGNKQQTAMKTTRKQKQQWNYKF